MWLVLAVVVVGGLIALAYAYWVWLLALYPEPVPADEIHWVTTADLWRLRVYRRKPASGAGEPVLLCHGLGSNCLSLLLPQGESLADYLASRGYDCWAVDYRGDRSAAPPYGRGRRGIRFEDYLMSDLPAVLEHIRQTTGYERVHWVGHSTGGMLLFAYELAHGTAQLASGVALATPPGFRASKHPGRRILARLVAWMPGINSFIGRSFAPYARSFRPGQSEGLVNWDNVHPGIRREHLFHMLDVPPGRLLLQMNGWTTRKTWQLEGEERDLSELLPGLRTPLLTVWTARDPFTTPDAALDFYESLRATDKQFLLLSRESGASTDYGHSELVFAPNSGDEVFEPVVQWLGQHPMKAPGGAEEVPALVKKASASRRSARSKTAEQPAADKAATTQSAAKASPAKRPAAKKAVTKKASARRAAATGDAAPASAPAGEVERKATAGPAEEPAPTTDGSAGENAEADRVAAAKRRIAAAAARAGQVTSRTARQPAQGDAPASGSGPIAQSAAEPSDRPATEASEPEQG